jgi:hypothetical protein
MWLEVADMTAAAEQRRLGRDKRRAVATGAWQAPGQSALRNGWRSELANLVDSVRVMQTSPRAAATLGALAGAVAGLVAADRMNDNNDGNIISGDVAVHLLNRIELLTIRLEVRHARRSVPTRIEVHRVGADASSRASSHG